jgi:hypothetical protein
MFNKALMRRMLYGISQGDSAADSRKTVSDVHNSGVRIRLVA